MSNSCLVVAVGLLTAATPLQTAKYPAPSSGEHILRDFRFASGETLPELRMHYRTFGRPQRDPANRIQIESVALAGADAEPGGSGATLIAGDDRSGAERPIISANSRRPPMFAKTAMPDPKDALPCRANVEDAQRIRR